MHEIVLPNVRNYFREYSVIITDRNDGKNHKYIPNMSHWQSELDKNEVEIFLFSAELQWRDSNKEGIWLVFEGVSIYFERTQNKSCSFYSFDVDVNTLKWKLNVSTLSL